MRLRRPSGWLLAALAAYLLLRGLVLWLAFDTVALPMYELYPMGTLPSLLGGDHGLALHDFYDNAAGQILMGLLTAPVYALAGPSYLALKLPPALLGLFTVWLAFALLREHTSARCAGLGALLFAWGPTTLTKYSLINSGNHFETLPFTLLTMWLFWRAHQRESPWTLAACGAAAGFALFVFLGALTSLGLLALTHVGLVGIRRAARDLGVVLVPFALGLAPLLWLNAHSSGRGVGFLGAKFAAGGAEQGQGWSRVLERLGEFFTEHLPRAGTYRDLGPLSGRVAEGLFLALFAAAWLLLLPATAAAAGRLARGALTCGARDLPLERALLVPLMAYLPLTALAFAISNLRIGGQREECLFGGYRYFNTHFLYACLLIALAARAAWARRAAAWRGLAAVGVSLAGAAGLFNLGIFLEPIQLRGVGAHYSGEYPKQIARTLLGKRQNKSAEQILASAESFEPWVRSRVYEGLAGNQTLRATIDRAALDGFELSILLTPYPLERRADAARGVGSALGNCDLIGQPMDPRTFALLERWALKGEEHGQRVAEGLCLEWMPPVHWSALELLDRNWNYLHQAQPLSRAAVARGAGMFAGRLLARGIPAERARIAEQAGALAPEDATAFSFGLGLGLADASREPRLREVELACAAADNRGLLLAGFAARLAELHGPHGAREAQEAAAARSDDGPAAALRALGQAGP
jgi:hypothetical protein